MRTAAYLIVALVISSGGPLVYGQERDPKDSLQQRLNGQFALTQITNDKRDIVRAGAVLVLQKGGLMMYSTASPMPPLNTYKNGMMSQGGSGFGRDLLITMAAPANTTARDYPHRRFVAGEKFWVTGLDVQKGGIVFNLYSDAYEGIRYYGQLKLPFEKGSVPTPDQAMARIAEVLTVQQDDDSSNSAQLAQVPGLKREDTKPGQGAQQIAPLQLPSTYVSAQTPADQLQLNTDNSFSLQEGGQPYHGTFVVNGNTLELNISETTAKTIVSMQGNNLTDVSGQTWVLREPSVRTTLERRPLH
jgi:hypothetical protein